MLEPVTSGSEQTTLTETAGLACHPGEQDTLPAVPGRGGWGRSPLLAEPVTWHKEMINIVGHNREEGKNRACLAG